MGVDKRSDQRLIILHKDDCPICEAVDKIISDRNIDVEVLPYNDAEIQELARKSGIEHLPVCIILFEENGERKIRGCKDKEIMDKFKLV